MTGTWNWITAEHYNGTASICTTLATKAQLKKWLDKYDNGRHIVRNVERPEGHHWDGSRLSLDEIDELHRCGGKR